MRLSCLSTGVLPCSCTQTLTDPPMVTDFHSIFFTFIGSVVLWRETRGYSVSKNSRKKIPQIYKCRRELWPIVELFPPLPQVCSTASFNLFNTEEPLKNYFSSLKKPVLKMTISTTYDAIVFVGTYLRRRKCSLLDKPLAASGGTLGFHETLVGNL